MVDLNFTIFFSVIIPTYNRGELVTKTINSVLSQQDVDFELLIVDDGSTDNTRQIIEKISQTDDRIKYFYQENSERAVARNFGAKQSSGQFLIFLDSDDCFIDNYHLLKIKNVIDDQTEKDVFYFTGATINSNNQTSVLTREISDKELFSIDFFIFESVIPARVCLPKLFFDKFSFDSRCIVVEDTVLWTQLLQCYKVKYIPIFSVEYNLHDGNSVNINKQNAYYKRLKGLKVLYNKLPVGKLIPFKSRNISLSKCYYGIYEFYQINNKSFISKLWILVSLLKYPKVDFKHKLKLLFRFK
jgi:glycosyltransferase involved in cell wall biosynthesis